MSFVSFVVKVLKLVARCFFAFDRDLFALDLHDDNEIEHEPQHDSDFVYSLRFYRDATDKKTNV